MSTESSEGMQASQEDFTEEVTIWIPREREGAVFCPGKACVGTWRQGERPGVGKIGRVGLGYGRLGAFS